MAEITKKLPTVSWLLLTVSNSQCTHQMYLHKKSHSIKLIKTSFNNNQQLFLFFKIHTATPQSHGT